MIIIVYFDFKLQVDTASCSLVAADRGGSNRSPGLSSIKLNFHIDSKIPFHGIKDSFI